MYNKRKISIRERLADANDIIILPGVYDALTAKIAEDVGFETAFQTGYGTSASLLGMPDFGFLNAGETLENAKDAREDSEFIIVARTDSLAQFGIEEAIERGKEYKRIGADVIFIEAPK